MNCEKCPCTTEGIECRKRPDYCAWAAAGDTARFAHIVNTSRMVAGEQLPHFYPSATTQAANLFRSAIGWARSGFKITPKAERARRLAICLACPKYDSVQKRCSVCGCFNQARVFIASDSCPLNPPKWTAIATPLASPSSIQ